MPRSVLLLAAASAARAAHPLPSIPWLAGTTSSLLQRDREATWFRSSGYSAVRRLVAWRDTEVAIGVYNWSALDALMPTADTAYISPWLVFTGANPLYDGGAAPVSAGARAAFAAFAGAAVARYASTLAIAECWDRPNDAASWPPAPDARAYAALCAELGAAVKAAAPSVTMLGLSAAPAPDGSGLDGAFVRGAVAAGALARHFDGVNVHLSRWDPATGAAAPPEALAADIHALRALLQGGPPVYSAVYSYATVPTPPVQRGWRQQRQLRAPPPPAAAPPAAPPVPPAAVDEYTQAEYLARAWMSGLVAGVNVTVWAAWRDGEECASGGGGGASPAAVAPAAAPCTLGAVHADYANSSVPYVTKPSFLAGSAPNRGGTACAYVGAYSAATTGVDGSNATCTAIYTDCGFLTPGFNAWCHAPGMAPGWTAANFTFPFNAPGTVAAATRTGRSGPPAATRVGGVCYWPLNVLGMQAGGLVCSAGDSVSWTLPNLGASMVYLVSQIWPAPRQT